MWGLYCKALLRSPHQPCARVLGSRGDRERGAACTGASCPSGHPYWWERWQSCPDSTFWMIWVISAERGAWASVQGSRGRERDFEGTKDKEKRWERQASQGIFPSLHFPQGHPRPAERGPAPLRWTGKTFLQAGNLSSQAPLRPHSWEWPPRRHPAEDRAWGWLWRGLTASWGSLPICLPLSSVLRIPEEWLGAQRPVFCLHLDPGSSVVSHRWDLGAQFLTFLCLSFLLCKVGIVIGPTW